MCDDVCVDPNTSKLLERRISNEEVECPEESSGVVISVRGTVECAKPRSNEGECWNCLDKTGKLCVELFACAYKSSVLF